MRNFNVYRVAPITSLINTELNVLKSKLAQPFFEAVRDDIFKRIPPYLFLRKLPSVFEKNWGYVVEDISGGTVLSTEFIPFSMKYTDFLNEIKKAFPENAEKIINIQSMQEFLRRRGNDVFENATHFAMNYPWITEFADFKLKPSEAKRMSTYIDKETSDRLYEIVRSVLFTSFPNVKFIYNPKNPGSFEPHGK